MTSLIRVLLLFVGLLPTRVIASESGATMPMKCFTDMSFHQLERDYVGYVVLLLEHRKGVSVVFQEGAGALEAPLLVDGRFEKGEIVFNLPSSALTPGRWVGQLRGKTLVVINPAGNSFTLKQICR